MITTSAAGGSSTTASQGQGERVSLSSDYLAELGRRSEACSSLSSGNLLGAWPSLAYLNAHASSSQSANASTSTGRNVPPPPGVHFDAAAASGPSTERESTAPSGSSSTGHSTPSSSTQAKARPEAQAQAQPHTLANVQQTAAKTLGYYPPAPLIHRTAPAPPPRVPEKCLTWCTQKDGVPALCRMLCLRKRQPLPSQSEALAKLRPKNSTKDPEPSLNIFESLRARLAPYSLIYVRGTAEGVVGRYMEELDADDGQYDFGPLSRHAPERMRRVAKEEQKLQYLNWGEDVGLIVHWPLAHMFSPIINLPANLHRVIDPPTRLVNRYVSSFSDGTQTRAFERFKKDVEEGGAKEMLGKIASFQVRKLGEAGFFGWLEDKTQMGWFVDKTAAGAEKDDKAKMARENDKQ